jgi:tetratricopeptide (TPR) repeat protein
VRTHDQRRSPLSAQLSAAQRDFITELRRLVDAAGLSFRALEEVTSGDGGFYSKSQWGRWLNGQSPPPRKAVRKLAERLSTEGIEAEHLTQLWSGAFVPAQYSPAQYSPAQYSGRGPLVARPPQQLPIAPRAFTGRDAEINFLSHLAGRITGGTLVIVIAGTAGVGKTTLATHLAHLLSDAFPDGQLFVNLRGFDETGPMVPPGEALRGFLESFGIEPEDVPGSLDSSAALYRSLLSGKRVLAVLDNARDPGDVRDLLPASQGCLVLVTSRNQMTGLIAQGAHLLRLDPFTPDEARGVLTARIGGGRVERDPDAADELIGICARLPLALSVACAYAAAHPWLSLAEVARDFRGRGLDMLDTGDAATTARSVFARSYRHVSEPAARMFRLLGLHPGPDIGVPAAASVAAVREGEARRALDELTRAHLVEEHGHGRFASHDLLRAYAAELARDIDGTEQVRLTQRRLLDHYLHTVHSGMRCFFPSFFRFALPDRAPGVTPELFSTPGDVLPWFQTERPVLLAAITLAADSYGLDAYCWQLPHLIAPMLLRLWRWHDNLQCQRIALAAAIRLGDPVALGLAHKGYSLACAMLDDTQAAGEHLALALQAVDRTPDGRLRAHARIKPTIVLELQERYAEALEYALEALRLHREIGDRTFLALSECQVGWIYAKLGQYHRALRHCEHALELATETGNRLVAADSLDALGMIHLELGQHDQALNQYRRALDAYHELGHPYPIVNTLAGLGDACLAAGDRAGARDAWLEALAVADGRANRYIAPVQDRLTRLNEGDAASG